MELFKSIIDCCKFNSIYFKDSLCHSNQASKVKTKNNKTEHKRK